MSETPRSPRIEFHWQPLASSPFGEREFMIYARGPLEAKHLQVLRKTIDMVCGWFEEDEAEVAAKLRQEPEKVVGAAGFEPATPTPPE